MILEIQVIGICFGLLLMYVTFLQYKKRSFSLNEWAVWSLLGLGFTLISLFPAVLNVFAQNIGVSRVMDLLIIMGFMFLVAAMFHTYRETRRTQRMLETVVRKLALEKRP